MTKNKYRKIRRAAEFTIVELLVIISVIMILISMLLPALSNAKMAVRRTACSNNLKQFGLGCNMYTTDCNGFFPVSVTDSKLWDYQLMDYVNYDYIHRNQRTDFSIYHCPAGNPSPSFSKYRARGYGYNYALANNINDTATASRITEPSFTVLITDLAYEPLMTNIELSVICGTSNHPFVSCSSYGIDISYRHLSQTNVLFADGHVKACSKGPSLSYYGGDGWIPSGTKWINNGTIY